MAASTIATRRPWRSELADLLPGIALAALMLWCVTHSIVIANWAAGLDRLVPVTLLALLAGLVFARLPWLPGWLAHPLSLLLGFVLVVQRLGPLMDERLATWPDQAVELIIRTIILSRTLAAGGRGEDIMLFIATLCLLGWMLGYGTAWMIFRRGWVWRPVLLNAIAILTNYVYILPKPTLIFFVFLGAGLLLIVYQQVIMHQQRWVAARIEFPDLLPLRFVTAAALCFGLTLMLTGLLPGEISRDQASRTWSTLRQPFKALRERWEDAFSTISAQPGTSGTSFTSRSTRLGGSRYLGDEVVMYVATTKPEYWRAVAFDRYSEGGWQNTTGEQARAALGRSAAEQARTPVEPGDAVPRSDLRGRVVSSQYVTLVQDRKDNFVLVGGQFGSATLPVNVEHSYGDGHAPDAPNFDDISLIVAREPLRAGDVYTVTALVSSADVQSLRQAGDAYPAWVRERYLQIPDTISPRTLERARAVVQEFGAANPYDQAVAIQTFLRTLPYNERIDAPPAGAEPVDHFLFELRQGYCDYYASAMVVMLRSLGVPARWVQGYAGGSFDPDRGAYVVRESVAHSWPEVYFPGFGWERFEPTPASYTALPQRPLLPNLGEDVGDRSGLDAGVPLERNFPDEEYDDTIVPGGQSSTAEVAPATPLDLRVPLALFAIIGGLAGLVVAGLWITWRRETHGLSPVARAYAEVGLLAGLAGLAQQPHSTPREFAANLSVAMPYHRPAIERIVDAYTTERYRPGQPPGDNGLDAVVKELRWPLIQRALRRIGPGEMPADRRERRRSI